MIIPTGYDLRLDYLSVLRALCLSWFVTFWDLDPRSNVLIYLACHLPLEILISLQIFLRDGVFLWSCACLLLVCPRIFLLLVVGGFLMRYFEVLISGQMWWVACCLCLDILITCPIWSCPRLATCLLRFCSPFKSDVVLACEYFLRSRSWFWFPSKSNDLFGFPPASWNFNL